MTTLKTDTHKIRVDGRTYPKRRCVAAVGRKACDVLNSRHGTFAVQAGGQWWHARDDLGYGRIRFVGDDGREMYYEPLGEGFRSNPRFVVSS